MFGYIRPRRDDLRVREEAYYRAAYCGLCRCLGKRYGMSCRFLVNYDITFLYLLLSAQESRGECKKHFCPANPLRRKPCVVLTPAMEYAADVCVILCILSLEDKRRDETGLKRIGAVLAATALRRHYRRAAQRQPEFTAAAQQQLALLSALEHEGCDSMDRVADAFAGLLSRCAEAFAPEHRRPVEQLLYHVGRFIYLTDALDDLAADAASGSYNPLLHRFSCPDGRLSAEDRAYVCKSIGDSVAMARAAFALYAPENNEELLQNIIDLGLHDVLCAVDRGSFRKNKTKATGEL